MNFRTKKILNLSCKYSYILLTVVGYTFNLMDRESSATVGRGVSSAVSLVRSTSRARAALQQGITVSYKQKSDGTPDKTKPRVSFVNQRGRIVTYNEPMSAMEKLLVDDSGLRKEKYISEDGKVKTHLVVKDLNKRRRYKVKKRPEKFVPNLPTIPE